jgi:adenylate cyclase
VTDDELEQLGVYDPTAPDAAERLTLLRLALERGAGVDAIRAAIAESRLHALAAERVMLDGAAHLTLADAAKEAGVESSLAARMWRALGFVEPEPETPVCTDGDVGILRFYALLAAAFGEDEALAQARASGAAMSRIADSSIQMVRTGIEAPLRRRDASDVEIATEFVELAANVVPQIYPALESVHRRHLVDAARRYSLWGSQPSEASTTEAIVGFADLVGYSALNEALTAVELEGLVTRFEQRVLDVLARPGARLVKVIGDEVMFVVGSAPDAAAIAGDLLDAGDLPPMRIGIAAGTVLASHGDLFGPVVNLAARLERLAEPGEALVDAGTARQLGDGRVERRGERQVAGFARPVEVFAISR